MQTCIFCYLLRMQFKSISFFLELLVLLCQIIIIVITVNIELLLGPKFCSTSIYTVRCLHFYHLCHPLCKCTIFIFVTSALLHSGQSNILSWMVLELCSAGAFLQDCANRWPDSYSGNHELLSLTIFLRVTPNKRFLLWALRGSLIFNLHNYSFLSFPSIWSPDTDCFLLSHIEDAQICPRETDSATWTYSLLEGLCVSSRHWNILSRVDP